MAVNENRARRTTVLPSAARGVARALASRETRLRELRERREHEHEALLRAARRVFLRRGYAQTRVEDVLREAGISTRAFYRFHAGKDELFLELFDRANRAAMLRLRQHVASRASAGAKLDAYVDATLDLAYEPHLRRETSLFANVPGALAERYATEIAACREQLVEILREIVALGRADGEFPAASPEDDAWSIHGALGAALSRILLAAAPPPRAATARRLRRFCRAALTGR